MYNFAVVLHFVFLKLWTCLVIIKARENAIPRKFICILKKNKLIYFQKHCTYYQTIYKCNISTHHPPFCLCAAPKQRNLVCICTLYICIFVCWTSALQFCHIYFARFLSALRVVVCVHYIFDISIFLLLLFVLVWRAEESLYPLSMARVKLTREEMRDINTAKIWIIVDLKSSTESTSFSYRKFTYYLSAHRFLNDS